MKTKSIDKKAGLFQIKRGIKSVAKITNSTRLSVCNEIGRFVNRTGERIEDWIQDSSRKKWSPMDLFIIVEYCMSLSPELDRDWAEGIFGAFGFSYNLFSRDIKQLLYKFISGHNVNQDEGIDIHTLLDRFIRGITESARRFSQHQSGPDLLIGFFIHSRLDPFPSDPQSNQTQGRKSEPLRAEDILFKDDISAILGLPGIGKSTLQWYLVDRLNKRDSHEFLAIPVDLQSSIQYAKKEDLLLKAIRQSCPDFTDPETQFFAKYLDERLEKGTAILLADNWSSVDKDIAQTLRGWKRILLFGRYKPINDNPHIKFYRLPELSDQEIRLFVKSWFYTYRRQTDLELLLSAIFSTKNILDLAKYPLFLHFICKYYNPKSPSPINRWQIINSAVNQLISLSVLTDSEAFLCRNSLSKLALWGYTNIDYKFGVQSRFLLSEFENHLGNISDKARSSLMHIIDEEGLLRVTQGGGFLSFPFPDIQAALAAQALLNEPSWLQIIAVKINKPPWTEVIIFAATQLDSAGDLIRLSELFSLIFDTNEGLNSEDNFLLACKCLAELDYSTRNILYQMDIGLVIRKYLSAHFLTRSSSTYHEIDGLIPRIITDELESDLILLLSKDNCIDHHKYVFVKALGKSQDAQSIAILGEIAMNKQNDYFLREEAILSLGKTQTREAVPLLQSLLQYEELCSSVVTALITHNSVEAAAILFSISKPLSVDASTMSFTNPNILPVVIEAIQTGNHNLPFILHTLASIGTDESIDVLERFLYIRTTFGITVELLSQLLLPRACDALIRFAKDKKYPLQYQSTAVESLPCESNLFDTQEVFNILFPNDDSICLFGAKVALTKTHNFDFSEKLIFSLNRASNEQRCTLVNIMIQHKLPELIPVLKILAKDHDKYIGSIALFGLSKLDNSLDSGIILQELQYAIDHDLPIDYLCAAAGGMRIREAIPLLARIFSRDSLDDKYMAVETLAKIGGSKAARVLTTTKKLWWENEGRLFCIHNLLFSTLAQLGEPEGIQIIIDCGNDPKILEMGFSTRIFQHLGNVNKPSTYPALIAALSHPNPEVRFYSALSLANMGCEKAIPRIFDLLLDETDWVGDAAFNCLTRIYKTIRDPIAIDSLVKAIQSTDYRTKLAALIAFRKIPKNKLPSAVRLCLRQIIETEPENSLFNEAIYTYAIIGKKDTCQYFYRLLSNPINYPSLSINTEEKEREIFFTLGQIQYLPFLLDHLPETKSLVHRLSENYDFRVLPNKSVVLSKGQKLSANDAAKWMMMSSN